MKKSFYLLALGVLSVSNMVYAASNDYGQNSGYNGGGNWRGLRDNSGDRNARDEMQNRWEGRGEERREAFSQLLSNVKDLNINISNGTITITGTLKNEQERQILLKNLNKFLETAKSVNNKLKITNSGSNLSFEDDTNNDDSDNSSEETRYSRINRRAGNELAAETSYATDTDIDAQILLNIQNTLKGGILGRGYDRVTSDSKNGKVTLRGTVDKPSDKQAIMEKIAAIDGVVSIVNEIVIPAQANQSVAASDDQIMLNIQKAIKGGMLSKGYERVTFDSSKGKVTLRGSVNDISDKKAILQKVAGLEGVTAIDNQIQVQPSSAS